MEKQKIEKLNLNTKKIATDLNKLYSFYYLVGQDVNIMSDVSGLDLVSNAVLIFLTLQTLGVGFLHYIHLLGKKKNEETLLLIQTSGTTAICIFTVCM